jgi:hypothetical protein
MSHLFILKQKKKCFYFLILSQRTSSISDDVNRPQTIQVNFNNSLECLLREIRYITREPLNYKIPGKFRELIPLLDNDRIVR